MAERNAAIEMDYGAICDVYPPFRDLASLEDFKVGKWVGMCMCMRMC